MSEELNSLLEKIHDRGVKKIEAERNNVISAAQQEALAIISTAHNEAAKIRLAAEKDADAMKKRAKNAIRQAARDILLDLRSELKRRLEAITRKRLDDALSADFMADLIADIVNVVMLDPDKSNAGALQIMISPAKCEDVVQKLTASIGNDLVSQISIFPNSAAGRGLKISVDGDQVFFDLSDTALSGMICEYAGNKVCAILTAEQK